MSLPEADSFLLYKLVHFVLTKGFPFAEGTCALPTNSTRTITVTASFSGFTDSDTVDAYQEAFVTSYSGYYLTFSIISGGSIGFLNGSNDAVYYRKNSGSWTQMTNGSTFNVNAGDKVEWKSTGNMKRSSIFGTCSFTCCTAGAASCWPR